MTELEEITYLIDILSAEGLQGTREECTQRAALLLALERERQFYSPCLGAAPVFPA